MSEIDLPATLPLPTLAQQLDRLISLGVIAPPSAAASGLNRSSLKGSTGLLVPGPDLARASTLAPLLSRHGRTGFIVEDMTDVDAFAATPDLALPSGLYVVEDVERGDELRGWSPAEALPEIRARGRTPLTLVEGINLLLQQPDALAPGHCFMTLGSRKPAARTGEYDARTPALWISGGTGRDGPQRRGAPKVGWCWWNNRHTWLGFASAGRRLT